MYFKFTWAKSEGRGFDLCRVSNFKCISIVLQTCIYAYKSYIVLELSGNVTDGTNDLTNRYIYTSHGDCVKYCLRVIYR